MQIFSSSIEQYGFGDTDILQKTNVTDKSLKSIFRQYENKIMDNAKCDRKTLTVVYYGGHGMMKENQS